jgi:hypothetical protein
MISKELFCKTMREFKVCYKRRDEFLDKLDSVFPSAADQILNIGFDGVIFNLLNDLLEDKFNITEFFVYDSLFDFNRFNYFRLIKNKTDCVPVNSYEELYDYIIKVNKKKDFTF